MKSSTSLSGFFSEPLSEEEMLKQLLAGNEAVFNSVFNSYYGAMQSVAYAIAGPIIADEVVQEAWFSAITALPKFEGRASLKSWLIRIVANEAKTRRRKENRSVSLEVMQESWATDPRFGENSHWINPSAQWHSDTPDELLSADELKDCIEKNMDKLPQNQLAALRLRDSAGLSMDELCNILDVSSSNVRVLLHRARDKVLQVVNHFQETGEC
ncbi:MAG: RNA polymerase sigma-70 factor (ECF subfamily) [Polaribacter sp.]|jgi:RNA polymerase sigma-70 factor (ECF subfamily)